ncbi:MAG TPA: DUF916 domain-containing protein [Patescibacteria group bacterium]|nr:DUF916 domain-containing protein [Patescibacteria group bacterium]
MTVLIGGLLAPGAASAQDGQVKLALRPIDQPGQFFDLTMRPGEIRTLEVELANVGDATIAVRTYAADVYTIINGGFGARLRDEPATGVTRWLDYSTDVLQVPASDGIRRTFKIAVPADAAPGEYITALILENDQPIRGSGDVVLDQVVRQATAIAISVPGARTPALAIGAARHTIVADKSVVAVEVENTGNVRLKPVADFVLVDRAGAEVSRASVPMDTFYAHTKTLVEVPLAALLQPGPYTVRLTLEDTAQTARAENLAIPLVVEKPPEPPSVLEGVVPGLTEVVQAVREGRIPLPVGIIVLVGSLMLGILIGWLIVVLRRRRRMGGAERHGASDAR